jgi:hypothetical protein
MMEKNIFLFFQNFFFYKKKSTFDSLISVIDPCGEIWLGPFNLHYCSTLDNFNTKLYNFVKILNYYYYYYRLFLIS